MNNVGSMKIPPLLKLGQPSMLSNGNRCLIFTVLLFFYSWRGECRIIISTKNHPLFSSKYVVDFCLSSLRVWVCIDSAGIQYEWRHYYITYITLVIFLNAQTSNRQPSLKTFLNFLAPKSARQCLDFRPKENRPGYQI